MACVCVCAGDSARQTPDKKAMGVCDDGGARKNTTCRFFARPRMSAPPAPRVTGHAASHPHPSRRAFHPPRATVTPSPSSRPPLRLADALPPPLALVADRIEAAWAARVPGIIPLPLRSDWEWADSGAEGGSPQRLRLENRAYSSPAFRKLHLEAAVRDDGLAVLHCVLYPRLGLGGGGFPILSLDAVAARGAVTLAIVDPCPARMDGCLLPSYDATAASVAAAAGVPPANRTVPDWGKTIFSRHCALTRPADAAAFLDWARYALSLHDAHLSLADDAVRRGGGGASATALADTAAAHARYAACQLANAKTRRVLEAAFGGGWAEDYMSGCMFDVEGREFDGWRGV